MSEKPATPSIAQRIIANIAIAAGLFAFFQAGMRGHRVGWEEMALYSGPAIVCGLIAVAMGRNRLGITALICGVVLGAVGFFLGA
jgi:energy-converting hydrogenase Eha subunit A